MAPSVIKQRQSLGADEKRASHALSSSSSSTSEEQYDTIERMPYFGFLSVPDSLRTQFKIPTGSKITKESIRLREVKTIGVRGGWVPLKPGDLKGMRPLSQRVEVQMEEDECADLEGLPNNETEMPFERLILWTSESDNEDPPHRIEVVKSLAEKLRPHQREGVQFLFECTMGLRGHTLICGGEGCILADDMGLGTCHSLSYSVLLLPLSPTFYLCLFPPSFYISYMLCLSSLLP